VRSGDVDEVHKDVRRRPGGRSARVRAAVLYAALEAMAEHGPSVTISEIARRAGVHATSIQRRWGTTENVIRDAMLTRSQEELPVPDTGTLRGDLMAFARLIAAYLATPPRRLPGRCAGRANPSSVLGRRNSIPACPFSTRNVEMPRGPSPPVRAITT
jgi:AcrR family transcriptional regulator